MCRGISSIPNKFLTRRQIAQKRVCVSSICYAYAMKWKTFFFVGVRMVAVLALRYGADLSRETCGNRRCRRSRDGLFTERPKPKIKNFKFVLTWPMPFILSSIGWDGETLLLRSGGVAQSTQANLSNRYFVGLKCYIFVYLWRRQAVRSLYGIHLRIETYMF